MARTGRVEKQPLANQASRSVHLQRVGLIVLLIVADQISKMWARIALLPGYPRELLPFLDLQLYYNKGAAFSMLSDGLLWQQGFLILVSMIAMILFIRWLIATGPGSRIMAAGLVLMIGGGTGNLLDRLIFSEVTDFISLHWAGWYFPVFNLADSAITVGAVLLGWQLLFKRSDSE